METQAILAALDFIFTEFQRLLYHRKHRPYLVNSQGLSLLTSGRALPPSPRPLLCRGLWSFRAVPKPVVPFQYRCKTGILLKSGWLEFSEIIKPPLCKV